jgi:phosphatidylglycerol:prolipoprotein diacylglycerol transferase
MHRILLEWPSFGVKLHSFSVALGAACLAALWLTARRARKEGLDPEAVYELAVWLMSGGFIGARATYLAAHPETVRSLIDVFKVWQGGIVFYGCIGGGLIGSILFWRRRPFPFRAMADAVAPSLMIGLAIGRLGCFLNGCCFGQPCDRPWALTFPSGSAPWARQVENGLIPLEAAWSLPVHPTQLYSIVDALAILGLLTWFFPRRKRDGEVMALLMVVYPVSRFVVESLRGDEPAVALGMTLSQWISVAILAAGVVFWAVLARSRPTARRGSTAQTGGPSPLGRIDAREPSESVLTGAGESAR